MIETPQFFIDDYHTWLKDKTDWQQLTNCIEITTPYLDRHNDYIQIYLKQEKNYYILTDDSYTLEDLEQSGYALDYPARQKFLETTLNGFGIERNDNELFTEINHRNFALNKHNLIQAILAVNYLFYSKVEC
ncbi:MULTISPECIES: DUF1828 domain-containing protein [unclassified Rickettsia]|uniref:DUF1828 domain-containing protein n=1 Tax=unclassified Rickettsia TaxID=114295 RepID=UPI003132FCD6